MRLKPGTKWARCLRAEKEEKTCEDVDDDARCVSFSEFAIRPDPREEVSSRSELKDEVILVFALEPVKEADCQSRGRSVRHCRLGSTLARIVY